MFSTLSIPSPRHVLTQLLTFSLILSSAFMLWKSLSLLSSSPSPIVVVLSGSMEPAFQRGDILLLWNRSKKIEVGEVVVYNVGGREVPIVHRVVRSYTVNSQESAGAVDTQKKVSSGGAAEDGKKANNGTGKLMLLTKGDNNLADDTELYAKGQDHLDRERDVIGSVVGYVPFVGYVTILLSENPWLKTVALGMMGVMVVLQRE